MFCKILSNEELARFLLDREPRQLVTGGFLHWFSDSDTQQDIIAVWEYGCCDWCVLYFPEAVENYAEIVSMAQRQGKYDSGWQQAMMLARYRIQEIEQALYCHRELAQVGENIGMSSPSTERHPIR